MRQPLLWPGQSVFRPWRLMPRYRRLVEHGARAEAVVLSTSFVGGNLWLRRLRLRVHFDDGETVEIARTEGHAAASVMRVGERVPVRYDPDDRRRVQIDLATYDAAFQRKLTRSHDKAVRRTEAQMERERTDETAP